jgi:hypothetical protein
MPKAFFKCAVLAAKRQNVTFFLATDHPDIRARAKAALKNVVFYEQDITRRVMGGHVTALIDLALLSLSDDLVTSTMSTFGYVAAALKGGQPALVMTTGAECLRDVTTQPCFHKCVC